jgi:hypothetical protein
MSHKPGCNGAPYFDYPADDMRVKYGAGVIDVPKFKRLTFPGVTGANGERFIINQDLWGLSLSRDCQVDQIKVIGSNMSEEVVIDRGTPIRGFLQAPITVSCDDNFRANQDVAAITQTMYLDAWEVPPREFSNRRPAERTFVTSTATGNILTREIVSIVISGHAGVANIQVNWNIRSGIQAQLTGITAPAAGLVLRYEDMPFNYFQIFSDVVTTFFIETKDKG